MRNNCITSNSIRRMMGLAALLLFGIELCIGLFISGNWVRYYLGDVLVIMLLYCLYRCIAPAKPQYGWLLPTVLLGFCFGVEGLQAWGFVDCMGITNGLLRTLIGTSFAWEDMMSYAIGAIPLYILEYRLHHIGIVT